LSYCPMPRRKSLGHKIGCLTYPSGCGGCVWISDCNWCFDGYKKDSNKTTVTPAGDDLYESDGTNDSSAEDDNLLDSEDDEISLESHQPPMIGNHFVNLPFLSSFADSNHLQAMRRYRHVILRRFLCPANRNVVCGCR
jgi:hypothetical protein